MLLYTVYLDGAIAIAGHVFLNAAVSVTMVDTSIWLARRVWSFHRNYYAYIRVYMALFLVFSLWLNYEKEVAIISK